MWTNGTTYAEIRKLLYINLLLLWLAGTAYLNRTKQPQGSDPSSPLSFWVVGSKPEGFIKHYISDF